MTERRRAGRSDLRRRAEQRLGAKLSGARPAGAEPPAAEPAADGQARLLHELRVHQVELEVQNEELRASRQETEQLLQRYTELFDFAPIGVFRVDDAGRIIESNFAGARLLGGERRNLSGFPWVGFVGARDQLRFSAFLAAVLHPDGDEPASLADEFTLLRRGQRGQEERAVRLTGVLLGGRGEARRTALLSAEDVTARHQAEDALREETHRKDEFLAALSHELRNPLAPIRLSLSLLRRLPPGSEKAAGSLAIIERQTAHLTRIVEDLLDVTRISRGKVRLARTPLDLRELVRQTVEDHRAGFEAAGVRLSCTLPAQAPWIEADAARVMQVIGNLLGNALKFTDAGGEVQVVLAGGQNGHEAVLRIRDTGVGIAPEVIRELFVPFSQGPQGLDRSRGGLGLGLATVKGLVELHGGTIAVRSDGVGRGSEFAVSLPVILAPAEVAAPAVPVTPRHLRVLVIEDNADAGASLRDLLELSGHEVRVALDGPTGVELAHAYHPDLVLCDLGLPQMDGFEVARALRADRGVRDAWLVALSGYAQRDDVQRAGEWGFDRHVSKPASPEMLQAVLHEAAEHAGAGR